MSQGNLKLACMNIECDSRDLENSRSYTQIKFEAHLHKCFQCVSVYEIPKIVLTNALS